MFCYGKLQNVLFSYNKRRGKLSQEAMGCGCETTRLRLGAGGDVVPTATSQTSQGMAAAWPNSLLGTYKLSTLIEIM